MSRVTETIAKAVTEQLVTTLRDASPEEIGELVAAGEGADELGDDVMIRGYGIGEGGYRRSWTVIARRPVEAPEGFIFGDGLAY